MERESGESYQALRSRLNAVIVEMGFDGKAGEDVEQKDWLGACRQVIDRLDRGELDAKEAVEALQKLRQ